jgi:hypothetical protein
MQKRLFLRTRLNSWITAIVIRLISLAGRSLGDPLGGWRGAIATIVLLTPAVPGGAAQAQSPFGGALAGGYISLQSMLQNPDVRKELNLSPQQLTKIEVIMHKIRERHRPDVDNLRYEGPEGRDKMIALMKTVSSEVLDELAGDLKPGQVKRLKEIRYQAQGILALSDPGVELRLRLNTFEKDKIKDLSEDMMEQIHQVLENSRGDFQEALARIGGIRLVSLHKALAILSDEQRRTWNELIGKPFDLKYMTRLRVRDKARS